MATPHQTHHEVQELTASAKLLEQIVEENRSAIAARYMPTLTVKEFSARERMLKELKDILVEGIDYGKSFEGQEKPTLLKPGAEKINAFFGYVPHYEETCIEEWSTDRFGEQLFYYKYVCTLQKDGKPVGEGIGSCSSWETKYRYRNASRLCPTCQQPAIIKGREEYGGGWVCFKKKSGCGAKFDDGDPSIEGQEVGRVPNPDIADCINTVQKIGCKRAYIASTLSATGASQYFTQDLEDMTDPAETLGTKNGNGKRAADPKKSGDAELVELVEECKSPETFEAACSDLFARIKLSSDEDQAKKVWRDAVRDFGADARTKRAKWAPMVTFMLKMARTAEKVKAEEAKTAGALQDA